MIVVYNRDPTCQVSPVFVVNLRDVVFWNGVGELGGPVLEANREVEVCECHMTGLLDKDCSSCQWHFSRSESPTRVLHLDGLFSGGGGFGR
ncbi:hypothetical protein C1H46_016873 [Malus baccata]|uniref:Uncharacterized protein n=1 Tax=Malus baccata TaxID=106549 RepID=A0A540MFL1_MALBA|nr:hypothetical protein C1H46_016873 [Malus baccata]